MTIGSKLFARGGAAGSRLTIGTGAALAAAGMLALATPAQAQYNREIRNDLSRCSGAEPAILVTVTGIRSSTGTLRVQNYYGTRGEWLAKGKWLNRVQVPARAGTMQICLPVPAAGSYAVAVRHDVTGNGKTDITQDGGAMSRNPSINIFNLGKPGVDKTRFSVANGVVPITVNMRYM